MDSKGLVNFRAHTGARHDRHTVSLLTDHMVFAPKYRGKMLVGDVGMICEGIICKTCKEPRIEIIEIAVKPNHVHRSGAASISGRRAASTGRWVRDDGGGGYRRRIRIMQKTIATGLVHKYGVCD